MRSKIMLFEQIRRVPGGGFVGAGVGETPSGGPQNGAAGVGFR